ncbi:aminobenzoyl-glutamate utilization protein B [Sporomusaceae bacterium BoRhaA]|uniref:M20 family metallopeptidase n=1 Tax=Pelorhabdus rhamnosifermentans TaxID=2772457 RepID=UPI001C063C1E|nr:M20 family metallopeptidase [Pelorhabdus rhamnosifermentans]MBU2701782.1 aminobenzoyl-glutamate utilization protein B [Pelorhabdus rhamnosifermentans]
MNKNRLDEIIDEKQELFIAASDQIWNYAETKFQEVQSAETLCLLLAKEGFEIEKGIAELSTAFVATFGSGSPVVALLGEYDALSGLSQKAGVAHKEAIVEGGNGHGCGHQLLGTGSLAAAVAVKKYLEENHIKGTIRYYGCPGEEGGSGKAFMARAGVFDDVDVALTWHPLSYNAVWSTYFLANYQVAFKFHGKSAHAASAPHVGRSALDAVELMNIGVNYLREHIIQEARVHYAVTNTGGVSPNVVQAEAEVLYLVRAPKLNQVQEIYERVCDIAKGAALMTGTVCEIIFEKACSNYIPNLRLEQLLHANLQEVGVPQLDEAEKNFAQEIKSTLSEQDLNNDLHMAELLMGKQDPELLSLIKNQEVSDVILPYAHAASLLPGSSDVGDVSWIVPTAQFSVACNVMGTPGHSWQMVAQGRAGLAHKGMLIAGKVLARTALDVFWHPGVVAEAKNELKQTLGGECYVSPIPPEVKPKFSEQ